MDAIDLDFENISYFVRTGLRRERTQLLHEVSGKFNKNQLIAIMGPSGAGKSTLLNILSGFKTSIFSGNMFVNGEIMDFDRFKKISCYITQDDRLYDLLTVKESMKASTDLKVGNSVSKKEREKIIENVLKEIGLRDAQNTLVRNLSGGQRKRLSIALELVSQPKIMFFDEPTTGLDDWSCSKLIYLLKELTTRERTIICTIHQPSAKLFKEFDHVYLLAKGRCAYQGSTSNVIPFLESIGLSCPTHYNPADYLIELTCDVYGTENLPIMINNISNGKCQDWNKDVNLNLVTSQFSLHNPSNNTKVSLFEQFFVLFKRSFLMQKRDYTFVHLRIGFHIALHVLTGLLFLNGGNEGSSVPSNYKLIFGLLVANSLEIISITVLTFPRERNIVIKEHFNRWYSLKIYSITTVIVDTLISMPICIIDTCIVYFMTSQPLELQRFCSFYLIIQLTIIIVQAQGLLIGALFSPVNGIFLGPVMSVVFMALSGFAVPISDMPFLLKYSSYLSNLRYATEGLVGAVYGNNRTKLDCKNGIYFYCHFRYPKKFLQEISMEGDQLFFNLTCMLIMAFSYRLMSYFALKLKIKILN